MNNEVKQIIVDLITRLWERESEHFETATDRNIFEAEMQEMYDTLEEKLGGLDIHTMEEYEEEIESLEEQVGELASRNEDLAEENWNLRKILTDVSEAVSRTWS